MKTVVSFLLVFTISPLSILYADKVQRKEKDNIVEINEINISNSKNSLSLARIIDSIKTLPVNSRTEALSSLISSASSVPITQDSEVLFLYNFSGTPTQSSTVALAGDHNSWNPQGSAFIRFDSTNYYYYYTLFPNDARIDYKFVINGSSWILDPLNKQTSLGGFGNNSELRMPNYKPSEYGTENSNTPKGTFIDTTLARSPSISSRKIRTYLPFSYNQTTDRYPLVLFHDGLDYWNLANVRTTLDNLIAQKIIPPIIAVFVPAIDRVAEYRTTKSAEYSRFIIENVLQNYIDKNYRTTQDSRKRVVVGASDGGHCALLHATNFPEIFGHCAAQSPNVTDTIFTVISRINVPVSFWLDIGNYDISSLIPLTKRLRDSLQKYNYTFHYQEANEGHSWGFWKRTIEDFLPYFLNEPSSIHEYEQNSSNASAINRCNVSPMPMSGDTFHLTLSEEFLRKNNAQPLTIQLRNLRGEIALKQHEMPQAKRDITIYKPKGLASGYYIITISCDSLIETLSCIIEN